MATTGSVTDYVKRTNNGVLQRGFVSRITANYPTQSAQHLADINAGKFAITLETGEIIAATNPTGGGGTQPPGGSVPTGTHIYTGAKLPQQRVYGPIDTGYVNLVWSLINGEVVIEQDLVPDQPGNFTRYRMNWEWMERHQIAGLRYHPSVPPQLTKFIIPNERFGNVHAWQNGPIYPVTYTLRLL